MENLDVFDELFQPLTPSIASIQEVHERGLWHQTFACWVVNPLKGSVILQLRGPRNRIDPGSLDASASGHLATGERPEDGFRELQEELGMSIPSIDRLYLGNFRNIAIRGSYINHEFCHVFLARSDATLQSLTLQQGEVSGAFEVNIEDAIQFFAHKSSQLKAIGLAWDGKDFTVAEKNLSLQDMCNWHERCEVSKYYLKVMKAAQGFLRQETLLVL